MVQFPFLGDNLISLKTKADSYLIAILIALHQ